MNIKMYIITHKEFLKPQINGYYSLLVGAFNKNIKTDFKDNTNNNISKKNKNYCELTGLYWMWKNGHEDVQGLCHYRRYFTKSWISKNPKYFLTTQDISQLMQKYDVIMPVRRFYKEKVIEAINVAPNMQDIKEMEKALSALCPEYLSTYHNYLNGNECYLYNMCIMKKELLEQYCEWLFKILFYIEDNYFVDNDDPYRSRLFGFLSERLIYVWLKKNIDTKKIKEIRVVKTDEKNLWLIGQDLKNILRNIYFYTKNHMKRGNRW